MKSNSWRDLIAIGVIATGALLVRGQRGPAAAEYHQLRAATDSYLLPPTEQIVVASLGYRSALADLIFGHVLVSYGLHFQEKRLFDYVGDYLDAINRLDPKFRDPYRYADTLLTLQPKVAPVAFYRKARQIQERGLKEFPYDQELWSTAGQFLAYLAISQLPDEREQDEYRQAGARYLMRACELIGSNENIPYHCITAATLLDKQGSREATRQFLERVLSVSDDPAIQEMASSYLSRVVGVEAQELMAARQERFKKVWNADLPFVPRVELQSVGPRFDPAACAGRERSITPECSTSWTTWGARTDDSARPRH